MLFIITMLFTRIVTALPNSGCEYSFHRLRCAGNNLILPYTFQVASIPREVDEIFLSCPAHSDIAPRKRLVYCNVISDDMSPLPFLKFLRSAWFKGFRAGRVPIDKLLTHNKHILTLSIRCSRIGTIDREYFSGFGKLQHLYLERNDIRSISVDAFSSLAGETLVEPSLIQLYFDGNAVEAFDWRSLLPIRNTLALLSLDDQMPKLRSLTLSGSTFSTSIQELSINDNKLKSIPHGVLSSIGLNASVPTLLYDRGIPFCIESKCNCCELMHFTSWNKIFVSETPRIRSTLSCGTQFELPVDSQYELLQMHTKPGWFDHCNATSTAVSSTAITTTTPTATADATNHRLQ
ncbi:uncharacterized protein LOC129593227 [Paramacrobiotus metropolitanus]|uniref:uncharacterized protein LOC129593227 n=1 Tax=Paramacrobiotus metropolitanus TaxID=2943436 RepID=UPI00244577D7|nr:uncharacterized protein LOC129593227 [Paramacrobiotus metropolitanus]